MPPNNEDISVPGDSPTGNGVTTGLPPTGDDQTQVLKRLNDLEADREKSKKWMKDLEAKHDEEKTMFQNEIKMMKKAIGPKAYYVEIGGDVMYYSNLKELLPRLKEKFANDNEGLQQLETWAKRCNKDGNIRVGMTVAGCAIAGATIGGALAISHHCGIVLGTVAVAGITTGPAVIIVFSGLAVGLAIALGVWVGYKLYQKHKLSKPKYKFEAVTPADEINDNMENAQEYILCDPNGAIVENVHVVKLEA